MSTYPLDEPHLAALRWIGTLAPSDIPGLTEAALAIAETPDDGPASVALRAISSPASAASLVRDLLAWAGAPALLVNTARVLEDAWPVRIYYMASDVPDVDPDDEDDDRCFEASEADVPRLISALVDLAPSDREGAMRAMREVWR